MARKILAKCARTVKKEVEKLRQKVAPKPKDEIWVVFWAPPDDEDTDVECVEMHSGKKFKCKYADVNRMIKLHSARLRIDISNS